ncbi:hypothetical protein E2C01_049844 [Portunus trituberculatus]|uniref:Uncharacterized protein n=1 Tax=Portunus trituberculatus TaxID=210409 RepID=A0A5B7G6P4_PORTR|nr:hypothetical protein [Portunus trituberculatus]
MGWEVHQLLLEGRGRGRGCMGADASLQGHGTMAYTEGVRTEVYGRIYGSWAATSLLLGRAYLCTSTPAVVGERRTTTA